MRRSKSFQTQEQRWDAPMVTVGENESLESAIKRFKKKVDDEGIIKTYRDRQYFVKPSAKRRAKKKDAARKEELRRNILDKKLQYASNIK